MPRFALITDEGLVDNVVLVEEAVDVETDDATGEVIAEAPVAAADYAERLFGERFTVRALDDEELAGPGWAVVDGDLVAPEPPAVIEDPELDPELVAKAETIAAGGGGSFSAAERDRLLAELVTRGR